MPLLKPGHSLKFAVLPEGQDPDDLLKAEGPSALKAIIEAALPLSEVLWRRALDDNDRATPERKAQFERDLRSHIHQMGDETVRKHYLADIADRLQGLWRSGTSDWKSRRGAPFATRHSPFVKHQKPWDIKSPPSAQLRALSGQSGQRQATERRERLIVLALANHPDLLHDFLDEFAALELSSRELDSLRTQIIDIAALGPALDGPGLRGHLLERGLGPVMDRLETQAGRLNEWFLGSGAAQDDARTGLRQMIALHRKAVTLDRELKAAEAAFAVDPTEENLNALYAVREQLSSHAGSEALIEGFGTASGRSTDALM